jgi:hypothetical protein
MSRAFGDFPPLEARRSMAHTLFLTLPCTAYCLKSALFSFIHCVVAVPQASAASWAFSLLDTLVLQVGGLKTCAVTARYAQR